MPKHQLDITHLTTVSRICKAAGITGYKTNHSLRVTTATRLFQNGVDEQLIMACTGHRSLGVRTYKRVGDDQKQAVSNILNAATNGEEPSKKQRLEQASDELVHASHSSSSITESVSVSSSSSHAPTIHFNGCTSVTINFNQCA